MNDLTMKLLAEKYQAVLKESSDSELPPGHERALKLVIETAHDQKPVKVYEIWLEGDTLKVSIDLNRPAEEGEQPAGAPAEQINPQMALEEKEPKQKKSVKKEPFKKNPFINKLKDKKGSFGDLGKRLG